MNLKLLTFIVAYWCMWGMLFYFGSDVFIGYTTDDINSVSGALTPDETDTGGLFSLGISFIRFAGLVVFGIGLGSGVPLFFSIMFGFWQTLVSIVCVGFFLDSIWSG